MPCRLKAQWQITLESLGQIAMFCSLCLLSGLSHPTVPSFLERTFLLPLSYPLPGPPSHHPYKSVSSHTLKWKCSELSQKHFWTWIISQSSSGHYSTNCSACRAGQAAVSGSREGHCSRPGEQDRIQSYTLEVIFVLSISLWSYPSIILAICKINVCNSNLLPFSCSKM